MSMPIGFIESEGTDHLSDEKVIKGIVEHIVWCQKLDNCYKCENALKRKYFLGHID